MHTYIHVVHYIYINMHTLCILCILNFKLLQFLYSFDEAALNRSRMARFKIFPVAPRSNCVFCINISFAKGVLKRANPSFTCLMKSFLDGVVSLVDGFKTIQMPTRSPNLSSFIPKAAHSKTFGCE